MCLPQPTLANAAHTTMDQVWIDDRGGYGFLRTFGNERVAALFNNSDTALEAIIPPWDNVTEGESLDLLSNLLAARITNNTFTCTLPPLSAAWFRLPD